MWELILKALKKIFTFVLKLVKLLYAKVLDWFQTRKKIKNLNDKAFTIKTELANGNYKIVQGIFDTTTEEIKDAVEYDAKELDSELAKYHEKDKLVIYT